MDGDIYGSPSNCQLVVHLHSPGGARIGASCPIPGVAQVLMRGDLTPPEILVDDVRPEVFEDLWWAMALLSWQLVLPMLELVSHQW